MKSKDRFGLRVWFCFAALAVVLIGCLGDKGQKDESGNGGLTKRQVDSVSLDSISKKGVAGIEEARKFVHKSMRNNLKVPGFEPIFKAYVEDLADSGQKCIRKDYEKAKGYCDAGMKAIAFSGVSGKKFIAFQAVVSKKEKEFEAIGKKALREIYSKNLQGKMYDDGINVKVTNQGKDQASLHLKWPAFNEMNAHQFGNNVVNVNYEQMKAMGYKKVVCESALSGRNWTWTIE